MGEKVLPYKRHSVLAGGCVCTLCEDVGGARVGMNATCGFC